MEVSINACGNILLIPIFPCPYSLGHDLAHSMFELCCDEQLPF